MTAPSKRVRVRAEPADTWRERASDAWRHGARRLGLRVRRRMRRFLAGQSLVGSSLVFESDRFPWMAEFEARWREIRAELEALLRRRDELPPLAAISPDAQYIAGEDWKTFLFYGFGSRSDRNCALCPETARLLDAVPGLQNAWFSILGPRVKVPTHKGITKGLLRAHLGLVVPDPPEACRMRLQDRILSWEEGRWLVFDDTKKHSVWNASDRERVVLLVDFERPLRWRGRLVARLFLAGLRRHGYYRDAHRNEMAWEAAFHGRR